MCECAWAGCEIPGGFVRPSAIRGKYRPHGAVGRPDYTLFSVKKIIGECVESGSRIEYDAGLAKSGGE